jgi:F-type H+-transporting ATPase subunit delta
MTSRAAAARYARALFDVALAEHMDVQQVERELADFAQFVAGNETLHRVLTNPAVPAPRKRAVIEQLLAHVSGMPGPVAKILLMLAERDRLVLLPELVEAYRNRLMDHMKVIRAEVITAQPLADESVAALRRGLANATGREVRLDARVNPEILGGAVARVGSTVYDGSITRQLERMKEALASATD